MPRLVDDAPRCHVAVTKVASRCNLNCTYCYVYNAGDETYAAQPHVMARATVDALIDRAAEHCAQHGLEQFEFVFHGGEPLLAGPEFFTYFVERAAARLPASTAPLFSMQTNGTLLTERWCELLRALNVRIGISVDGPKAINDRQRVDHAGKGSYDRIRRGWELAQAHGLDPGLLAVIDVRADPLDVFAHLLELKPRKADFLFPQANHDKPPPHAAPGTTPYADWLLKIFAVWIDDATPPVRIRLFERIVRAVLGLENASDAMGPGRNEVIVIETDGGIEPVDVLKICRSGITKTPLNVARDGLDDAFAIPLLDLYHFSGSRLCAACNACRIRAMCAGGYLPHRFSEANAFDNPSVYCADLMKLISAIQNWVVARLPAELTEQIGLVPLAPA